MGFGDQRYWLTVKDPRTGEAINSGVYVLIYDAGTKTLATLYSNNARTSKTNPITRAQFAVDDQIEFYAAATTVDVFIADDKGNTSFVAGIAPTQHTLFLNRDGVEKCMFAPFLFNVGGTEVDTGLDFPLDVMITDAIVEVVTLDAGETIDVGILSTETNGDANGILAALSIAAAGFIRPYVITETTTEDYISAPYFGSLMGVGTAGTSTANDNGTAGGPGHIVSGSNGRSLTYTPSTSDTGAGYIYVYFKHLR